MLTQSAFNAVLKTLEEPPAHAVFILATTEPQKIPATILSRCMRFDFKLIPQKDLENLIKSVYDRTGKTYEDSAITAIARAGAGSARDSLSIADMCASYSSGKLTYEDVNAVLGSADFAEVADLCSHILGEDASAALSGVENILSTGKSVGVLVKDILSLLNNLAIVKVCKNPHEIVNLPDETFKRIKSMADGCDGHKILRVTEIMTKAEGDMRYAVNPRITLETAVYKCAVPSSDYDIEALLSRISSLEKKLEEGVKVQLSAMPVSSVGAGKPKTATGIYTEHGPAVGDNVDRSPVNPSESLRMPRMEEKSDKISAHVRTALQEENEETPFKSPSKNDVQPSLWDSGSASAPPAPSNLGEGEKSAVFGKFVRALRTTHKNAVLFTLCMDLGNFFEGDKLVLTTESEAVFKALNRAENSKFITDVLLGLGVLQHEVRLTPKGESEYDKALKELKNNFNGIDIEIK